MSNSSQRKFGAILSYISIIVNSLIQLLYTPFLIKMLGQSEYGLYSLVSSIIGYLTILDLGFGNAIIVYTAKYREQKKYDEEKKMHGMFFVLYIIIAIFSILIGLIIYLNVNNIFSKTMTEIEISKMKVMMLILTFNLAITFVFSIYSSIINAHEKFIFRKIMAIMNSLLKPIIMIPLLFLGYKSIAMAVVITIVNVIVLLSNYIFCKNKLKISIKFLGFDKKIFKEIISYSFFIFLGTIVEKVNWSVDHFILGVYCGTIAVSVYSVASQLNALFINLSTAISGVLLPKVSKMVANNVSGEELTNEMIKVGRIQYYIIFLMASGLTILGKNFINLWVGPNFKDSYYIALILIIPLCFPLIQNLGLSIMQAMNKYKFKSISAVIMSLFNVIISIFLAQRFGAIGAAIGTAISLIICNIILINIYYYKVIRLNVIQFWKEILKMTSFFVIPVLLIILIMKITNLNGWVAFLSYGFIYVCLFILVSYYICMNKYEKNIIDKVLKKIHVKRV